MEFDSIHLQGETAEFDPAKKIILNRNYNEAINFLFRILIDKPGNFNAVFGIGSMIFMDDRNNTPGLYLEKAEERTLWQGGIS